STRKAQEAQILQESAAWANLESSGGQTPRSGGSGREGVAGGRRTAIVEGSARVSTGETMKDAAATPFAPPDHELCLITAAAGTQRGGLIATFVTQASLPANWPRLLVGLSRQHHTWGLVEATGFFAAHLLAEDQLDWVWRFGLQSGRTVDKFADLTVQ